MKIQPSMLALIRDVLRAGSITADDLSGLGPNEQALAVAALLCDPDNGIMDEHRQVSPGWAKHVYRFVGDMDLTMKLIRQMHKAGWCSTDELKNTVFDLPHSVDTLIRSLVMWRTCVWVQGMIASGDLAFLDEVVPSMNPPVMIDNLDRLGRLRRVASAAHAKQI